MIKVGDQVKDKMNRRRGKLKSFNGAIASVQWSDDGKTTNIHVCKLDVA